MNRPVLVAFFMYTPYANLMPQGKQQTDSGMDAMKAGRIRKMRCLVVF